MRKLAALLLALLLLLGITACGGTEPVDSSTPASSMADVPSESSLPEESTTASSKLSADTSSTSASITTSSRTNTTTSRTAVTTTTTASKKAWYTKGDITITKAEVDAVMAQTYKKPKNVIVMIGDGMGPNDIAITEKFSEDCFDFGLVLNRFVNTGYAKTHSADNDVTDSAASGTALATGVKTNNTVIGMSTDAEPLENIAEIARKQGKKIGIVTNDTITGATPSTFLVHCVSRYKTDVLANAFIDFAPDVLIGQGYTSFAEKLTDLSREKIKNSYILATTISMMSIVLDGDLTEEKSLLGFFSADLLGDASNTLAQCTEIALNRLDNENGFFLMVESAGTDKAGDANNIVAKMNSVVTLDRAVAVVLNYMKSHPDTLLIVTSDHDNGGVQMPAEGENPTDELFTADTHTAQDVRVFALGYGAEYFRDKTVDNTDIGRFAISAVKGEMT